MGVLSQSTALWPSRERWKICLPLLSLSLPLTCEASWTIFDHQLNLIFCFFSSSDSLEQVHRAETILSKGKLHNLAREKDFSTEAKQRFLSFLLNEELKLENPAYLKTTFILLLYSSISRSATSPFSYLWEMLRLCTASIMESPHHPSRGISLLLVYAAAVSTPIHPGIETAWAGMENPTSV